MHVQKIGGVFVEIINREDRLCSCCMEEHEVKTVLVQEKAFFKNEEIEYEAEYLWCDAADEFYMNEDQMKKNDVRLKDAYRKKVGLLTSSQIKAIRAKYGINQIDLCLLLGWGGKTITRYESHQVQDKAHDTILKKISQDPEWFIELLSGAKNSLTLEVYQKYWKTATKLYEQEKDSYLKKSIEACYVKYKDNPKVNGNTVLSLEKVVDVIRYFSASRDISNLYKVKLMKMMWYADALSYKQRGRAITGLVYQALPMGAVPVKHSSIIELQDVPCKEIEIGESNAYHFSLTNVNDFPFLSKEDTDILDEVIMKLGQMTKDEIVDFMHKEEAYLHTPSRDEISFEYAKHLLI